MPVGQTNLCTEFQQLAAAGIRMDLITTPAVDAPTLQSDESCLGSALESIEGPNEYDNNGGSWAATLLAYQPLLYSAAKAIGNTPVFGPALSGGPSSYAAVSGLGTALDSINMHNYFAGRNPGTTGWGATDAFGTYGSLAWNIAYVKQISSIKPIVSTETGYSDAVDQNAVPAATKARYLMRTLLEHWNAGVTRTYLYELSDEGGTPFSHYGITNSNGNLKPAYTAMKNFLAVLSDAGGDTFSPGSLRYTLTAGSNVAHSLLQKLNGVYELVLWVEAPEYDVNLMAPVTLSPQTVTIALASAPHRIALMSFDDSGNATSTSLTTASTTTILVTGSPEIFQISP